MVTKQLKNDDFENMVHVAPWGYFPQPTLPQHLIDKVFSARAELWHVLKYVGDKRCI